ncbi:hypothetical protein VTH82DRAFT_5228 [Thermothelomyces myriococcoides]
MDNKSNNNLHGPRSVASEPADLNSANVASSESAFTRHQGEQEGHLPGREPTLNIHGPSPSSASSSSPSFSSSSPNAPSTGAGTNPVDSAKAAGFSLPISLPSLFRQRSGTPSASIAPSTAEGKPILSTDPADDHRTSALQKLNSKYSSASRGRGYTPEASGAQSSTYSRPVIVRTYSGPSPSRNSRSARSRHYGPPSSSSQGLSQRVPFPSSSSPGSGGPGQPIQPTVSGVGISTTSGSGAGAGIDGYRTESDGGNVCGVNMSPSTKAKKGASTNNSRSSKLTLPWPWALSSRQEPEKPSLPPLEAFSFKSFLADLEARGGDNDIGADLDRIAEICARSRYSLSNQYEVHVPPHGSGASFVTSPLLSSSVRRSTRGQSHSRSRSRGHVQGPTLQVITSDDESAGLFPRQGRRTTGGKRKSAAYGTLETIMSSSRSSEEGKATKKSAAELVNEVRGRAARKAWENHPSASSISVSSSSAGNAANAAKTTRDSDNDTIDKLARRKPASFATAIMDTSSNRNGAGQTTAAPTESSSTPSVSSSHRRQTKARNRADSASALLSDPAWPQTSSGNLGEEQTTSRPAGSLPSRGEDRQESNGPQSESALSAGAAHSTAARSRGRESSAAGEDGSIVNSWGSWIPWRTTGQAAQHQHQRQQHRENSAEGRLRQLLMNGGDGGTRQVRVPT